MRYYGDIWSTYIPGQDGVSHVRMVASHCCPFELSSFNELYMEKPVCSITFIPTEIF